MCAQQTQCPQYRRKTPHLEFGSMPPSARLLPFGPASAEADHAIAGPVDTADGDLRACQGRRRAALRVLFGSLGCPPAITILHEAAHNAGATGDIDKDGSYPPPNAEDNSYSYEHFVEDLKKACR